MIPISDHFRRNLYICMCIVAVIIFLVLFSVAGIIYILIKQEKDKSAYPDFPDWTDFTPTLWSRK